MKVRTVVSGFIIGLAFFSVSCNKDSKMDHAGMDHSGMDHSKMNHDQKNQNDSVAKCPVMGGELKEGEGIKFVHNGLEFWVKMEMCKNTIIKNFDKYKQYGKPVK